MAFTVRDLNDLLALLEQHPEWRARLRQILLTEELLRLPQAVDRLTEAVHQLIEEVRQLRAWQQEMVQWQREMIQWQRETTEWQKRVNEQLEQLIAWQKETVEWQREMIQWQRETTEWQKRVNEQLEQLIAWQEDMKQWRERVDRDLSFLKGSDRENFYRSRAVAIFGILVRKGKDPTREIIERLHDALEAGQISQTEFQAIAETDVLWSGEFEGHPVVLVVEVSFTVGTQDLTRAIDRAKILRKLGYIAVPVIAGVEVPDEIEQQARNSSVIVLRDGWMDRSFAKEVLRQAIGTAGEV